MKIINLEGHPNCITGSRVTAILLNLWFCLLVELQRSMEFVVLPIGGASAINRATPSSLANRSLHEVPLGASLDLGDSTVLLVLTFTVIIVPGASEVYSSRSCALGDAQQHYYIGTVHA